MSKELRKPESVPMKVLYGAGIVVLIVIIVVLIQGIRSETSAESPTEVVPTMDVREYPSVQDVLTMFDEYNVDVALVGTRENTPFVEESLDTTINVDTQKVSAYVHTFSDIDTRDAWLDMS